MVTEGQDHDRLIRVEGITRELLRRIDDVEKHGSYTAREHEGRLTRLEQDVAKADETVRQMSWRVVAAILSAVVALGGLLVRAITHGP